MKHMRLFFLGLTLCLASAAFAQVPPEVHLQQNVSMPFYRVTPTRKFLDMIITGTNLARLDEHNVRVDQFQLKNFRDGDPRQVQIIAQAPHCEINVVSTVGSDAGPLHVFTPTTNLYVQGIGFYFTQSNQFLRISNQVETRVVRSLLKSPLVAGGHTNTPSVPEQILKIFAHTCRYDFVTRLVNYAGQVHVIDPQLDLTSGRLDIQLTTNSSVQTILASDNVKMTTTNHGWGTADTSFYYVTNYEGTNTGVVQLTGHAVWHNGDEKAVADQFIYDGGRHLLTGLGHVRVWWPNPSGRVETNSKALLAGTNGFRELFADFVTLQMPPTNGPIQSMTALGNVIIVNQADKSRALAERAAYDRASDRIELTGQPTWWNDTMKVQGQVLTANLADKTYHVQTISQLELTPSPTQRLLIYSDSIDYQTNLAIFNDHVHARLFEKGALQDTLTCHLLKVGLRDGQIEKVFARGDVAGETATNKLGVEKTLSCDQVMVLRSITTRLLKNIEAEGHVVLQEIASSPVPLRNKLTADVVTARFSTVTNQIERAVADRNVVLDQIKAGRAIHATSTHAVYDAGLVDQVKLTGTPLAHTDDYAISEAAFMIWKPKANTFTAAGTYKIVPLKAQKSQHL
jgi:lipopolysaccharide export system protein LptA